MIWFSRIQFCIYRTVFWFIGIDYLYPLNPAIYKTMYKLNISLLFQNNILVFPNVILVFQKRVPDFQNSILVSLFSVLVFKNTILLGISYYISVMMYSIQAGSLPFKNQCKQIAYQNKKFLLSLS